MAEDGGSTKASASLQKTVLIVAAVCEMLSICMISSNISRYNEDHTSVYNGILILSLTIMVIWIIAFFGVIYKFDLLIYFAWTMWAVVAFLWFFFISGCISPTRCPEGLWLIENVNRKGVPITSTTDFYYHEYHIPFPDKRPKKKDADWDIKAFDEISYVVDNVPLMKFNGLYIPWSSLNGAIIYTMSFSLVFIFFTITLVILWRYSQETDSHKLPHNGELTEWWKCRSLSYELKTDSKNGILKQGSEPVQSTSTDSDASIGQASGDIVSQTANNAFGTSAIDLCDTTTHFQECESQQQHVCCSCDVCENSGSADNGQTCDEQPGLLDRVAKYVNKRPTNK